MKIYRLASLVLNFRLTHLLFTLKRLPGCSVTAIRWLIWTGTLCMIGPVGYTQRIFTPTPKWQLQGQFLSDSVKIGQPIRYALTLKHSSRIEVIFPDSSYRFSPFEFAGKQFFPTRTNEKGISIDSAVYILTTFSIDSIQSLSVPVYIAGQRDCTLVFTEYDSVLLHQLIRKPSHELGLKVNTVYVPVPQQTNYLFVAIVMGAILSCGLLIYALFGKQIGKRYRLFRMGRHTTGDLWVLTSG